MDLRHQRLCGLRRNRSRALVILLLSLQGSALFAADDMLPGRDYVQGKVIVIFGESCMPAEESLDLANNRFGNTAVDSLIAELSVRKIKRFLTPAENIRSRGGRMLTRTFSIDFVEGVDAQDLVSQLRRLACFERVMVNRIVEKTYYALRRWTPDSTTTKFGEQWYLDDPNDKFDIDMPEAWAITRGDQLVIIVINDSGAMVDTCSSQFACDLATDWRINGDFNYVWITAEDTRSPGILNRFDIRGTDDDLDGVTDNIIGANFAPGYAGGTTYQLNFWRAMPTDLRLSSTFETPTSWRCIGYITHGTKVGSIACGRESSFIPDGDIVGVANRCRVYWTRAGLYAETTIQDEADAILHSAKYADVINMSWGFAKDVFDEDPGPPLSSAIECAAQDFGCVLVAAVGNDHYTDFVPFPAQYDEHVLAVGAVEKASGTLVHKSNAFPASGYSNFDANNLHVDVVAPVHDGIWADDHTKDCEPPPTGFCPCYTAPTSGKTDFGTSFAAPQASGVAAVIRSRFGNMKQDSVRARIKRAAEFYSEWDSEQYAANKYGSGKINAYRSITEWGRVAVDSSHAAEWGGQRSGWPDTLYVSGDLFIEASDTLILNPGTVIRVAAEPISHNEGTGTDASRVEIIVRGTLRIGTTGTGPVIFESFPAGAPTASDWGGIRFEVGSRGTLRNVHIKNAQLAIRTLVPLTLDGCAISMGSDGLHAYANVTVRNTTIHNLTATGIRLFAGSLTVTNSTIYDCDYGIDQSTQTSTGAITCTGTYLHDFDYRAVNVPFASSGVTLKRTTIEDATDGVFLATQTSAVMDSCTVRRNDIGVTMIGTTGGMIRYCEIDSNATTGVYLAGNTSCVVESDTVTHSSVGVYCYYGSGGTIQDAQLLNNSLGLKCEVNASPTVRRTRIAYGGSGVLATDGSNPDLGHATGGTCGSGAQEGRNSIHNHTTHHVANFDPAVTVYAECNWWGGTPAPQKFYGNVDYTPYRSGDPNP
jgi:hypothetical protein